MTTHQFGTSDDPDLAHRIAMGNGGSGWNEASRYQIWTRSYPLGAPELTMLELRPAGLIAIPGRARLFHVVPAGVPYRVKHLFGFYRISESDTMFLRVENADSVAYTMIVGTHAPEYTADVYAWFCPDCGAELRKVPFETRRFGTARYWSGATARAREFNADLAARRCANCGGVHPVSYGFDETQDTPDEAAARAAW